MHNDEIIKQSRKKNLRMEGVRLIFDELNKQVTQQHKEQGMLMHKLWNTYFKEFESMAIQIMNRNMVTQFIRF